MSVTAQVLFDTPQHEIAPILRDRLDRCVSASLVAGFVTPEGVKAILPIISANHTKLEYLVVGAGTYKAFEAMEGLLAAGVPPDRLKVHLGHSRPTEKLSLIHI